MQRRGLFITGSDTDVGKTWVGRQLVQQLQQRCNNLKVRKPIESGCETDDEDQLIPADGSALFYANQSRESLDIVTPYRLRAALAPDRAAALEGIDITLQLLVDAVTRHTDAQDTLLVEGAGGFYSPIARDGLNADLARRLGLPVIIVVEDRLGAINQALLTSRAVSHEGLDISALVLNQTEPVTDSRLNNLHELQSRLSIPLYHCPFGGTLPPLDLN